MASQIFNKATETGRLDGHNSTADPYASRPKTTADIEYNGFLHIGWHGTPAAPFYRVARCFLTFDLSSLTGVTVTAVTLDLDGRDGADSGFDIGCYESNFGTLTTADFNEFTGWKTGSQVYTPTLWSDLWASSTYVSSYGNIWTFNAAGRTAVEAALGGDFKFCMLSDDDINYTYNDSIAGFEITPKLEITYTSGYGNNFLGVASGSIGNVLGVATANIANVMGV